MYALLIAALLTLPQDTPPGGQPPAGQPPGQIPGGGAPPGQLPGGPPSPIQDGQWTIVYVEVDGAKMQDAKSNTATIRGNMLTYMENGKQCTLRLDFGPNNLVRAMKVNAPGAASPGQDQAPGQAPPPAAGQSSAAGQPGQPASAAGQPAGAAGQPAGRGNDVLMGVYINSDEFFCLCLYGMTAGDAVVRAGGADQGGRSAIGGGASGSAGSDTGGNRSGAGGQGAGNSTGGVGDTRQGGAAQPAGNVIHQAKTVLILRKGGAANR